MDDTKIKEILKNKDPKELLSLFNFTLDDNDEVILLKFNLWSRYFFPNYHASLDAPFHEEINKNNLAVYRGKLDSFVNIAFRGAGKDVKTQLLIAFVILNDKKHFRRYFKCLSDDKMNSGQSVTDIYNMLVNPKIVSVYNDTFEKTVFKREERRDSFTTKSGIKVLADIVGTGQRGAKQEEARPDFIWFNDFETRKTLRSAVITRSIWDNMEEARTGLEYGGSCVYTCNYVSEVGNVHRLVTENLGKHKKVLIIPIMKNGVSTWERYTPEDIEAMRKADDDFEGERMCLKPNTLILTKKGWKEISSLEVGDMVQTHLGREQKILQVMKSEGEDLLDITVGDEVVTITKNHPVLVGSEWIPAGELVVGDFVNSVRHGKL